MARTVLHGTPVSPGIAIGVLHFLHVRPFANEQKAIPEQDIPKHQEALNKAVEYVRKALQRAENKVPADLAEYRDIIAAQREIAGDSRLVEATLKRIKHQKISASSALTQTLAELCTLFQSMDDPYLRDRVQDVRTVGLRLQKELNLQQFGTHSGDKCNLGPAILGAEDISPADVIEFYYEDVLGIVTNEGGLTSHAAILARGLHIPAVVNVSGLLSTARATDTVILDGLEGCIIFDPLPEDLEEYTKRRNKYFAFQHRIRQTAHLPAVTQDQINFCIRANLDRVAGVTNIKNYGAEGIGLYRTEFSFLKGEIPTEEELYEEYCTIVHALAPDQVIFRTLDIGADKMLKGHYVPIENNPALGLRGIRFCLRYEDIFRMQLRALLRAGIYGKIAIMLPMISNLAEIQQVRLILREVQQELTARKLAHISAVPLGVLVETPAAVLACDLLAEASDFFSIGSNDLVHYLMSIDRGNRHVAYLHDPLQPAVLRAFKQIIDVGHSKGLQISICGELAADPGGLAIMLGLGIDNISVAPHFIPGVKEMIRKLNVAECVKLTKMLLNSRNTYNSHRILYKKLWQFLGADLILHTTSLMSFQ